LSLIVGTFLKLKRQKIYKSVQPGNWRTAVAYIKTSLVQQAYPLCQEYQPGPIAATAQCLDGLALERPAYVICPANPSQLDIHVIALQGLREVAANY